MKNLSKYIAVVVLLLSIISCTEKIEKPKPLIEIYQVNKRIVSHEGKAVEFTDEMTEMDRVFTERYGDIMRVTEDGNWTPNGNFKVSKADLQEIPLVSSQDIKGFDFKNNQLVLSSNACYYFGIINTINDGYPDTQLVLTIDKKPILNFYRAGMMSKWDIGDTYFVLPCDTIISDDESDLSKPVLQKSNSLQILRGPSNSNWFEDFPNLKQDTTFYNAFKRAGKIIAE